MTYPFDPKQLNPPGVVPMPEPTFRLERDQIREAQQQIIDAQPNTYFG